jgi:hypothetical protein
MSDKHNKKRGRIARAAASVKGLFSRKHHQEPPRVARSGRDDVPTPIATEREAPHQERPIRRNTDIPMEQLDRSHSPAQTSLKAPFRATGADQQRDQEFANGVGDARWNDEDHYTNSSGDPRIGTHRRSYEPGERDTLPGKK